MCIVNKTKYISNEQNGIATNPFSGVWRDVRWQSEQSYRWPIWRHLRDSSVVVRQYAQPAPVSHTTVYIISQTYTAETYSWKLMTNVAIMTSAECKLQACQVTCTEIGWHPHFNLFICTKSHITSKNEDHRANLCSFFTFMCLERQFWLYKFMEAIWWRWLCPEPHEGSVCQLISRNASPHLWSKSWSLQPWSCHSTLVGGYPEQPAYNL